mmetsp:Transcript_116443/g.228471  ORF Transcript_116443/g.228471 Transcript_116443/m.228471 type:complete len:252 (-) Transcript_116443:48-803(-)
MTNHHLGRMRTSCILHPCEPMHVPGDRKNDAPQVHRTSLPSLLHGPIQAGVLGVIACKGEERPMPHIDVGLVTFRQIGQTAHVSSVHLHLRINEGQILRRVLVPVCRDRLCLSRRACGQKVEVVNAACLGFDRSVINDQQLFMLEGNGVRLGVRLTIACRPIWRQWARIHEHKPTMPGTTAILMVASNNNPRCGLQKRTSWIEEVAEPTTPSVAPPRTRADVIATMLPWACGLAVEVVAKVHHQVWIRFGR